MSKIINLRDIKGLIKPNTATLVGGVFDLFHIGHLKYLRDCSSLGRPLVVIVQTDKTVKVRKGFNRPIVNQSARAEIVASLEFVDYVLILDKPSHYDGYIEAIKPRTFVFSKENTKYRLNRKRLIEEKFPDTNVVMIPKNGKISGTTKIISKILNNKNRDYNSIEDPIKRKLYYLVDNCISNIGKVSALLFHKDNLVAESKNNAKEVHAEILVIKEAKKKKINLSKCSLYISIPPCIMCAQEILKHKIPKVYYLDPYGNDDGIKLLRDNGIKIKKYTNKS